LSKRIALLTAGAVVAVVSAITVPVTKGEGAYSPDLPIGSSHVATHIADKVEPDPTDDGSIIIECVALGNRLTTGATRLEHVTLVGVPRIPLGPSKCWPQDQT
jgi:hypothetical protein